MVEKEARVCSLVHSKVVVVDGGGWVKALTRLKRHSKIKRLEHRDSDIGPDKTELLSQRL